MADEHVFYKEDLPPRFDQCLNKTFEEIDTAGMFQHVHEENFKNQKGIIGSIVEQCILGYSADTRQAADLLIVDSDAETPTELKATGVIIKEKPYRHLEAKEPMSITAVGIYDIADQEFETSHFLEKIEHMLIVYYHYNANGHVTPYEYRFFRLIGYEFHEFTEDEIETLKQDWEHVRDLCKSVTLRHPDKSNEKKWKKDVQKDYIDSHNELKKVLTFIDLAPKFPPRFRLKKPVVTSIVQKHFGDELEQLPGRYITMSDIDKRCKELEKKYTGKTISELIDLFHINSRGMDKAIAEKVAVAMFEGKSSRLNQIELFSKFGLVGKTFVMNSAGCKTEDMKLFQLDFSEITQSEVFDEEEGQRRYCFEDSDLYSYFSDTELLCILFEEPKYDRESGASHPFGNNKFIGFKRLVFDDSFIETKVRLAWEDTRDKILNKTLKFVAQTDKNGNVIRNKTGEIKGAPNFIKSSQNDVFIRGSAPTAALKYKTECINGIQMPPQYVWVHGTTIVSMLKEIPLL